MIEPTYSVVVVTYDRDMAVQAALEAIMNQSVGRDTMEVCVINNGGADRARERWADRVDAWIDSPENLGCAGGRNRGVEVTHAPILVFIDDDGIVAPDFVERLGEVLLNRPEVIAVRGRAVALRHPILSTMARHYDRGPRQCEDLLTLEGGAAIRRSVYEAAGGYDATRAYHEGLELSGRLLEASPGGTMVYAPDAVLRHDFFQGWRHLLQKAQTTAKADERVEAQSDLRLEALLQRARNLSVIDGRRPWQRLVGWLVNASFQSAKRYFKWRARLENNGNS